MQDRVPVNPGRVLVTPENGGAAYYATLTRADNPTQEGTPLNKAALLKDATAALFGLGGDAVPDDVLAKTKTLIDKVNTLATSKTQMATGSYVGAVQYGASNPNKLTFEFAPKLVVIVPGYTTGKGFNERLLVLPYGADYVATAFGGTSGSSVEKPPHSKVVDVSGWGSKTISWYSTNSASAQMNESACTYYWAAFA